MTGAAAAALSTLSAASTTKQKLAVFATCAALFPVYKFSGYYVNSYNQKLQWQWQQEQVVNRSQQLLLGTYENVEKTRRKLLHAYKLAGHKIVSKYVTPNGDFKHDVVHNTEKLGVLRELIHQHGLTLPEIQTEL